VITRSARKPGQDQNHAVVKLNKKFG